MFTKCSSVKGAVKFCLISIKHLEISGVFGKYDFEFYSF